MNENELSHVVIGAAIDVHKELGGPGMLEDIYEEALCIELGRRGLDVKRQVGVRVMYKDVELRKRLVLDVLVNDSLIVEVKSTEKYHSIFESQLLTYLRATKLKLGLVINFGEKTVKDGIHRVVNGL
jgi:GxxExxY protein